GFIKSAKRSVGVNYGRFTAPGPDLFAQQVLTFAQAGFGGALPVSLVATPTAVDVCIPILSGRVTVTPNSQKIVIAADQFTPADREIVIRNQTLGRSFHFPRNVAEYRFL